MKTDEIVTHLRRLSDVMHDEGRAEWCVITAGAADALEAQEQRIRWLLEALDLCRRASRGAIR